MLNVSLCECKIRLREGRALLEATQHEGGRASQPGRALTKQAGGATWQAVSGRRALAGEGDWPWLPTLCWGTFL